MQQLNQQTIQQQQHQQQQQQQQQQQRFNQRRHFGAASKNPNAAIVGGSSHRNSGISETMQIFQRSQQQTQSTRRTSQSQQLFQSRQTPPALVKDVVESRSAKGATPSSQAGAALPPLEAVARRSNASSNTGQRPTGPATGDEREEKLDANQNYLPIITTSRSEGKLTGRPQQPAAPHYSQNHQLHPHPQLLLSVGAVVEAKSDTGAEPPTVRVAQLPQPPQPPPPPPPPPPQPPQPPHLSRSHQQAAGGPTGGRKSASSRRRRVTKGGGHSRQRGDSKAAEAAAAAKKPKRIPIVYFSPETGSVKSASLEDVDARSCDMRNPNATVAYSNVLDYIRDNQLMNSRKAKLIWAWLNESGGEGGSGLFVYDPSLQWYSLPGDLIADAAVSRD